MSAHDNKQESWCDEINEMEVSVADDDASIGDFVTSGNGDMYSYEDFVERFVERPIEIAAATTLWISPTLCFPSEQLGIAALEQSGHQCAELSIRIRIQHARWIDSMARSQQSLTALQELSTDGFGTFQDGHVSHVETVPCTVPSHDENAPFMVVSSCALDDPAPNRAVTPWTVVSAGKDDDDAHSDTTAMTPTSTYYSTETWQQVQILLMHRLDESMERSRATNPFWATVNLLAQAGSENLEFEVDQWQ
jgi:hypothetical protein